MNKYQEALNKVREDLKTLAKAQYYGGTHLATLQELVDKETPVEAIVYNINQFKCPRCKKQIKGRLMLYNMETRKRDIKCKTKVEKIYCPYCSQKLDWGDECE